jgi:hypothetical protein
LFDGLPLEIKVAAILVGQPRVPSAEINRTRIERKTATLELDIHGVVGIIPAMHPHTASAHMTLFVYSHAQVTPLTALLAVVYGMPKEVDIELIEHPSR